METVTPSISVTIPNPTQGQIQALMDILESTQGATSTATKPKKTKPLKTAAEDTEAEMDEEDLASDDSPEDEEEESEEEETEDEDDQDDESLSFDTVKAALNKYGAKHPDEAKAILLGFNIKSTKELSQHKKKWEPVYRKVMAKLKKTKGK